MANETTTAGICFLQETYSTKEIENSWKMQWKGDMFLSHGSEHSRVILILLKNSLEFELKSVWQDSQGRFILLEAIVQDQKFVFLIIYTSNKFYSLTRSDELNRNGIDDESRIIAVGDFNVILDPKLDGQGGNPKLKESWKWQGQLTLLGKIQKVKSFAIPKFMSKAALLYVSKDVIQAVNK